MRNRSLPALLAAAILTAAAAAPAAAQTDSIYACYVPTTGNVYRIKTPDTHASCVSPSHVQFSWVSAPDLGIGGKYLLRLRSGSPLSDRFAVDSAGGVLAIGELGIGTIPFTGEGYRMMWYPFKSAFRAGYASGSQWNDASIGFFSWAGGTETTASAFGSFAFGDQTSVTSVLGVGFGSGNVVSGTVGFASGASNRCTGFACTALGFTVTAGGQGAVALGYRVTADADFAVALGYRASANGHDGAFVIADQSSTDSLEASADNQFSSRYAGGYRLFTNAAMTTGVTLNPGGSSWSVLSDRNRKENFLGLDGEDVLARLRRVPVTSWNYIAEGRQVRHIGPMAQDWHAAFPLNDDPLTINSGDFDGVNLAAIQALERRTAELREKTAEVDRLRAEVASLRESHSAMERRLAELEALLRQR